ncbi:2-dehydro-3-deoxyphosphogluconate aldolase / (4S)-4-hydroxy-2-oxoglutarate aldolase [Propionibacterium cyclohexanicum]|uniref:2-dehydro-3-deoxy-phosphogluconate aldolase n=1 Tax=Propionibacterium cyclohexanicum TaxID=64702 RepID=A0A1H9TG80_9ACTN|nr:bifunctional 4-hydroxy-2-oxoglutarate aldolase/2-dehydro-3-deoxy-phosphogluconate aldolase [Propionibacterium cyclohexanicum]SER95839.1 2-dehydro-3-deoxyphosphogluconate aldolase / (4S)-4-hydroxy-2-oxoglutarate aldolase [Propionibacterium cyclohexanicum]
MTDIASITAHRIVPVVVLNDAANADGLAQALVAGGLPVAEVTFRTPAAQHSIEIMAERGDILVGAGTVITARQVDQAVDAGASFIVSPGYSQEVIDESRALGVPVLPGVVTSTEILSALSDGMTTLKFFPAGAFGGAKTVKALSAPFPQVTFIPTGGVNLDNVNDYLSLSCVPAVGGSWMVPADLVDARRFDNVQELTAAAVRAVEGPAVGKD